MKPINARHGASRMAIAAVLSLFGAGHASAQPAPPVAAPAEPPFPLPRLGDVPKVAAGERPTGAARDYTCYLLETAQHPVAASGYVILTDHREPRCLAALRRLAAAREGELFRVEDLAALRPGSGGFESLEARLRARMPRYVAIAPRFEAYRDNMVVSMWALLSGLDDDRSLDVLPGFLVAPDHDSFEALIARSIAHAPQARERFRPALLGQVVNARPLGVRSLQKVAIMRRHFAALGYRTPALVTLAGAARGQRSLEGPALWYADAPGGGAALPAIPEVARAALAEASLLITYGHGTPGKVCSLEVGAFAKLDMEGKVVLSGSCFSAAPSAWDVAPPKRVVDGPDKERFALRAIQNGATVCFGHMKFNGGFPYLNPVLAHWLRGGTVGEGYQRLLNALLASSRLSPSEILAGDRRTALAGNRLLYVVIGDPALRPFRSISRPW
jgi:hypothetical protein